MKQSRQEINKRLGTEEALRAARAQMWRLAAQYLTIQESERRRIAADLHDGHALKHANANRITVSLTVSGELLNLVIEDNGRGFDTSRATEHRDFNRGIGLQSMKERGELSGGSYEFRSSPGQGTRVSVRWLRVKASDRNCPVIPVNQALAQSMCKSALNSELPEDFSVCVTCVRGLECQ